MSQSATPTQAEARPDFEHILGTFPLVFPDNAEGRARKDALLAVCDRDLLAH